MTERIHVTLALPLADELHDELRDVDSRLEFTALTSAQRRSYRGGRPLWGGYGDVPATDGESPEEAAAALEPVLQRTEVLLCNPILPEDLLERASGLRWLQLSSAGIDRLADTSIARSELTITTASGIHAATISEYVIGMMIAFAKRLPDAIRSQSESAWRPYWPAELEDQTVGIVGAGNIGTRVGLVAKAMGMRVLGIRRSVERRMTGEEAGDPNLDQLLPPGDLPYLLRESDYVVLGTPLTPETRGMIGAKELALMKPTAVIINIARGAVIDEQALISSLKEKRIAGAGLDVFSQEPLPPESELWGLENVIMTPHISGGTPRYMERVVGLFCDNLRRYVAGEELVNIVDSERGY
ncbi:MAG: D-2-hydroxyacid dehydrogenase [Chloroflexi bacterium]|nr:D-2-hydroxyacid dehydrogenase [Chloroflexota bacterium]